MATNFVPYIVVLGGIAGIVMFLRPRYGLPLLIMVLPIASKQFSIKAPIQTLNMEEIIFYPILLGYIGNSILNRRSLIRFPGFLIALVYVSIISLFYMNNPGLLNILYLLGLINMIIYSQVLTDLIVRGSSINQIIKIHIGVGIVYILIELLFYIHRPIRLGTLISSPNVFGDYLITVALPLLSITCSNRKTKAVFLLGFLTLLTFTALLLTGSRGALFSTVCGIVFWLFIGIKSKIKVCLVFLGIALIAGLLFSLLPNIQDINLFNKEYQSRFTSLDGASVSQRMLLLQEGLNLFKQHPIIGNGPGTFVQLNSLLFRGNFTALTHNYYLDLLVSYGIPGLAFFILFLFVTFFRLFQADFKDSSLQALKSGVLAAFFACCLHLFFINGGFQHTFWFLISLCQVLILKAEAKPKEIRVGWRGIGLNILNPRSRIKTGVPVQKDPV